MHTSIAMYEGMTLQGCLEVWETPLEQWEDTKVCLSSQECARAHTSVFVLEQYMSCSTSRAPSLSSACCTVTTLSSCNSTTHGQGRGVETHAHMHTDMQTCRHAGRDTQTQLCGCPSAVDQSCHVEQQRQTQTPLEESLLLPYLHTRMDAVHAFSEQPDKLGSDLHSHPLRRRAMPQANHRVVILTSGHPTIASLLSSSHQPPIILPSASYHPPISILSSSHQHSIILPSAHPTTAASPHLYVQREGEKGLDSR